MENSNEIIDVPVIFVCSDEFKWLGKGIQFDNFATVDFPQNCGDEFKNVRVVKDKPMRVEIRKNVVDIHYKNMWGGDGESIVTEFTFEEGITYNLQIIKDVSGKKKIEISIHDPEISNKNHIHKDMEIAPQD